MVSCPRSEHFVKHICWYQFKDRIHVVYVLKQLYVSIFVSKYIITHNQGYNSGSNSMNAMGTGRFIGLDPCRPNMLHMCIWIYVSGDPVPTTGWISYFMLFLVLKVLTPTCKETTLLLGQHCSNLFSTNLRPFHKL